MKLSEAVSLYIQMRDKKTQMKAEFDASIAPLNEKMDKLEAKLLDVFNKTGMDSVKTEFGTAYATTRTTASIADREVQRRMGPAGGSCLQGRSRAVPLGQRRRAAPGHQHPRRACGQHPPQRLNS